MSSMNDNTCSMTKKTLPKNLVVGYCNWNQCDDGIIKAVENGVNVVMWFAINLDEGLSITNGPDMDCVADIVNRLNVMGYKDVVHLISIGGWNAPHPSTSSSALETFQNWNKWNTEIIARPEKGFYGFDGFDWDIEGNDDVDSRFNVFTKECLDFMGEFSQLAKASGYLVAMAPAESYLDCSSNEFSLSLKHTYDEWLHLEPPNTFAYHGRNTYAYLLAKYNETIVDISQDSSIEETSTTKIVDTFDFVTIQLYEGYSHAMYHIGLKKQRTDEYLRKLVQDMNDGWMVHFSGHGVDLDNCLVHVPREKLVIGLANGWANDGKFVYIDPRLIRDAYKKGMLGNRGFAFWNIKDEGLVVEIDQVDNQITDTDVNANALIEHGMEKVQVVMAKELGSIFR